MKVLLLAGGASNEREVSMNSGAAVFDALKRLGHKVQAIDPANGQSLLANDGKFITSKRGNWNIDVVDAKTNVPALANALSSRALQEIDVVFIALHGGAGENGTIQCLLDLACIPYTGSNMTASAVAMDKAIAKRLFASEKILTPDWGLYRLSYGGISQELLDAVRSRFSFPIIVKPNDSGSTIGLTKVDNEAGLLPALEKAYKESPSILVEEYIPGRELTVAVLDGQALPVVEIKPKSGLYDYESKYTKGKTEYIVPAEIDPKIVVGIQEAAAKAYRVTGASGLVRIDFILGDNGRFYCLEVNTVPGMTNLSLAPMAAKATGIEFDELIARMIHSAVTRHRNRSGSESR